MSDKEINYTRDWCMPLPKDQEAWEAYKKIMKGLGVEIYSDIRGQQYNWITTTGDRLIQTKNSSEQKVDIYGAVQRLTRPVKTEQQLQIEALEETVKEAAATIEQAKQQIDSLKQH